MAMNLLEYQANYKAVNTNKIRVGAKKTINNPTK